MSGGLKPEDVSELHRLSEVLREGTHYELLGVAEDFDRTALKNAYHNLSRRFHPDRYYRQDLGGGLRRGRGGGRRAEPHGVGVGRGGGGRGRWAGRTPQVWRR